MVVGNVSYFKDADDCSFWGCTTRMQLMILFEVFPNAKYKHLLL